MNRCRKAPVRQRSYGYRFFHSAVTGQLLCAVSIVCMVQANIGTSPWNVLKQGLTRCTPLSLGAADILVSLAVIGAALILGERIGFGSLFCVFFPGPVIDLLLMWDCIPCQRTVPGGILLMLAGICLMALSTFAYMVQGLGAGPRDALMVALSKKACRSIASCRIVLDGAATLIGWRLGGQVGLGTILSVLLLGPCIGLVFRAAAIAPGALEQETLEQTCRSLRCSHSP